jgi:hypothetical protein
MQNLFFVYFVSLYMFRAYLGPSSGGTTICLSVQPYGCLSSRLDPTRTTDSYLKRIINTNFIHRLYRLMMDIDTLETCRGWLNIRRMSCASSLFFFTQLYRDARSTKHKKYKIIYIYFLLNIFRCIIALSVAFTLTKKGWGNPSFIILSFSVILYFFLRMASY